MGFWSSIFGGSNPTLNTDIGQTGQQAGFDTGEGQGDVTAGDAFLKSILGGDASKTAQVLAPQISALKTSVQNDQKTAAQNGTRSGGTTAGNLAASDKAHADITNLIGDTTAKAATALPEIGTTLTQQGTAATVDQSKLAQQRMQNWANSILGKGVSSAIGAAESYGLGAAAGGGGGAPSASGPATPIGLDLEAIGGENGPLATTPSDESNMWLT